MKTLSSDRLFFQEIDDLYQKYLPSKHPFFQRLATYPHEKLSSPTLLGQLYLRYQAACHATRVMVYLLPYLDSPALRIRKLSIISDDDSLENGDAHHYQMSRAFVNMGATLVIEDEEFGCLEKLKTILDPTTANFVSSVQNLYPLSLGPWCTIEIFAEDWMRALMNSLSNCFPDVKKEPYFADCFAQGVEERHAQEALELTGVVLSHSPHLLNPTLEGAKQMAVELDKFWSGLDNLLKDFV